MKLLISGGAGFIAKNLSQQLSDKYEIKAFGSQELNLLDPKNVFECIRAGNFDVVIHTATYDAAPKHSTKDPSQVLANNLRMFFNIARCQDYFGKMIYFGSGAEFSREYWVPKMKEDYFDQHVPQDQYGFSKYIMTKYALRHDKIFNLRLFGVFGKHDDWRTRIIPNICCRAVYNRPIKINQNKSFDFININDLVVIVRWFIDHKPKHKAYNVCTGQVHDFKSIARRIIKISGKDLKIMIKKPGLGTEYSGSNALLLKEIKDLKFTPFNRSIKALYQWYDTNKHKITVNSL